ncbi:MAG: hypothetical protein ACI4AE_07645 [Candidatus Cryptobacteroides sp.]
MKKSILSLLVGGGIILAFLAGCQKNEEPTDPDNNKEPEVPAVVEPEASAVKVTPDLLSAEIVLKTSGLTGYACLSFPSGDELVEDPQVLFATGTTGDLADGENTVTVRGLSPQSTYTVVFAFKESEESFFKDLLKVEVTTLDYVETFTVVEKYPDGFKFHIKVPQSVKDAGHAIRYNVGSLPFYLSSKGGWRAQDDATALIQNGQQSTLEDVTLVFNSDNVEVEVMDPWTGEPTTDLLHTPFVPGEPIIYAAGEFAWGEAEDNPWGMNEGGYFVPLFDYDAYWEYLDGQGGGWGPLAAENCDPSYPEDDFWTGYFTRRLIVLDPPALLDANVDIQAEMGAVNGTITISPDSNVYQYCVMVLDEGTYQTFLEYLDGNEDYLQWAVTSYFGWYSGSMTLQAKQKFDLTDLFYYVDPESDFHVLLTAMGDATGTTQKFYHEIVSTTAKTMPAPEVEVKAISNPDTGETSPYEVWFNVKCTSKDAVSAMYAANYEREFGMMFNSGYTYNNIVEYGNSFTEDEVALINSDEGLNVMFTSMPDAETRLAVLAYNEEATSNNIDENPSATAVNSTDREPAKAAVDSPLFKDLLGEWTMSAGVASTDWYGNVTDEGVKNCKVTISGGFTYPETLPASVYDTYKEMAGLDEAQVDALYDQFKQEVDEFNAKLKGQNRLLCMGFGYESNGYYYDTVSPFDLFISDSYNGYDIESMIWDCGPKWYLEVKDDGSVVAPINQVRFYPLKSVTATLYLAGYDISSGTGYVSINENYENADFPVAVSDDKATLTVNPFVYQDVPYYLNAMQFYGIYGYIPDYTTVTPLLLTKGWSDEDTDVPPVETASVKSAKSAGIGSANGIFGRTNNTVRSKTPMKAVKKCETIKVKHVDIEEGMRKYVESYASKR